ncbi:MAG: hypothetical protein IPP29_10195 [Bacteroidetes bacterium]|nr:hypothetical protein [Bacteroidota bacterium]
MQCNRCIMWLSNRHGYGTAADGTAPYSYSWSNGSTDASITGLAAGVYSHSNRCKWMYSNLRKHSKQL